jgi:phosphomannomutase
MSSDQQYAETATPSNGATISSGPFAVPDLRRRLPADDVPEISRFFGIVIVMFYDEHGRPHFHARYGGEMVSVEIDSLLVSGQFPGRQLRLVLDWAELHRTELLENWDRARLGLPLVAIEPLR